MDRLPKKGNWFGLDHEGGGPGCGATLGSLLQQ